MIATRTASRRPGGAHCGVGSVSSATPPGHHPGDHPKYCSHRTPGPARASRAGPAPPWGRPGGRGSGSASPRADAPATTPPPPRVEVVTGLGRGSTARWCVAEGDTGNPHHRDSISLLGQHVWSTGQWLAAPRSAFDQLGGHAVQRQRRAAGPSRRGPSLLDPGPTWSMPSVAAPPRRRSSAPGERGAGPWPEPSTTWTRPWRAHQPLVAEDDSPRAPTRGNTRGRNSLYPGSSSTVVTGVRV